MLLGPAYTLLRSEFAAAFAARHEYSQLAPRAGPVLVFMGGADLAGLTLALLTANDLSLLPGPIHVLVGAMNPRRDEIERHCQAAHIPYDVASRDVGELLKNAKGAIVACGMFAVELQALGVPSVLVPLSDIQRTVATYFAENGMALVLEPGQLCETTSWQTGAAFLLSADSQPTTSRRVAIPLDGAASVVREMTRIHFEHRHPKPL
jgi:spore coat polysaccharide biosynthesis predicted glycosyltransferase SpsG